MMPVVAGSMIVDLGMVSIMASFGQCKELSCKFNRLAWPLIIEWSELQL
jgi:hypothetical protein